MALTFADTHNMIAYLTKSERFDQIIDFLNESSIKGALRLDDTESIDCLPNEEIFTKLSRMGYEKPSTKLTFYKEFLSPQWKFLIHTILQCMSAKRTSWNEFSSSMASAVICLSTVGDLSSHSTKYSSPALTKKVFTNMRRVGKGFSRVDTPLFEGMLVAQQVDESAVKVNVDDVSVAGVANEGAADVNTNVVLTAIDEPTMPSPTPTTPPPPSQDLPSSSQEPKPLKKQAQIEQDEAYTREFKAELNKTINWDDVIDQVQRKEKEDNAVMRYQALKRKPQTEVQARKNMMTYLRNMAGFKMDYFKGMKYDDIHPIFEKYFNSNVAFLEKTIEHMEEEEDSKALKRISESQEDKAAKKQKLDEEVPIVDYEIYTENNKPYYKIIRVDGSPQLFLSFLSLLRNFNQEDLEVLWELVKERFSSSKTKNFSDDFLLTTLTYMFEKPDVQAQMILLVEIRYPLSRFTLDQMLNNVRLEVEEESEVSLELLRFVRQQQ
nr:hypothetical protein [Tanacetum cinerariifolium]